MKTAKLIKMYHDEIYHHFDKDKADYVAKRLVALHQTYSKEHLDAPANIKQHYDVIFVGVAIYNAIIELGYCKEEALKLTDEIFNGVAVNVANIIRKLLKVPGLYKLVPNLVKKMVPKKYNEASGFRFKFYDTPSNHVKFDMIACPYYAICKEMGVPELTVIYCNNDDCCYGNMHPKLKWTRHKTIGRGDQSCDFDIKVKEN